MLLTEICRTATVAWSPRGVNHRLVALGTLASTQHSQSDSSAKLEIFDLLSSWQLEDSASSRSNELTHDGAVLVHSVTAPDKFQNLAWRNILPDVYPQGIITGGLRNGAIGIWNAADIINGEGDEQSSLLSLVKCHTGMVGSIDFNQHQPTLLASGSENGQVYIWNLTDPTNPTVHSPGSSLNSQSDSTITSVAFNPRYKHILAASSFSGNTVIWDLREKRPAFSFNDPNHHFHASALAWSPDNPMQLVTASDYDEEPILHLWDLRVAMSPSQTFTGHRRGITSVSWSVEDTSLLLSTGKDYQTICWDVSNGQPICQIGLSTDWNLDVQWSIQMPTWFNTSSLDGHVRFFSLQDFENRATTESTSFAEYQVQQSYATKNQNTNVDTNGRDFMEVLNASANASNQSAANVMNLSRRMDNGALPPTRPPSWMKVRCGASFTLTNQYYSFDSHDTIIKAHVIENNPEFVDRAQQLHTALQNGDIKGFCDLKIVQYTESNYSMSYSSYSTNQLDTWLCIASHLSKETTQESLARLHFDPVEMKQLINQYLSELPSPFATSAEHTEPSDHVPPSNPIDLLLSSQYKQDAKLEKEMSLQDIDHHLSHSPPSLFPSSSSDHLFKSIHPPDHNTSLFDDNEKFDSFLIPQQSNIETSHHLKETLGNSVKGIESSSDQFLLLPQATTFIPQPHVIKLDGEDRHESIMLKSLLIGDFKSAVECSIRNGNMAEALILSACGGNKLWADTQAIYFKINQNNPIISIVEAIMNDNIQFLVNNVDLVHWKEMLAILFTYTKAPMFNNLCEQLGDRLYKQSDEKRAANLCYTVAGSKDKIFQLWINILNDAKGTQPNVDNLILLQDLIEKYLIFLAAIDSQEAKLSDIVFSKILEYAEFLVEQGRSDIALYHLSKIQAMILPETKTSTVLATLTLIHRLYHSLPLETSQQLMRFSPQLPYPIVQVPSNPYQWDPKRGSQPLSASDYHKLPTQPQPNQHIANKELDPSQANPPHLSNRSTVYDLNQPLQAQSLQPNQLQLPQSLQSMQVQPQMKMQTPAPFPTTQQFQPSQLQQQPPQFQPPQGQSQYQPPQLQPPPQGQPSQLQPPPQGQSQFQLSQLQPPPSGQSQGQSRFQLSSQFQPSPQHQSRLQPSQFQPSQSQLLSQVQPPTQLQPQFQPAQLQSSSQFLPSSQFQPSQGQPSQFQPPALLQPKQQLPPSQIPVYQPIPSGGGPYAQAMPINESSSTNFLSQPPASLTTSQPIANSQRPKHRFNHLSAMSSTNPTYARNDLMSPASSIQGTPSAAYTTNPSTMPDPTISSTMTPFYTAANDLGKNIQPYHPSVSQPSLNQNPNINTTLMPSSPGNLQLIVPTSLPSNLSMSNMDSSNTTLPAIIPKRRPKKVASNINLLTQPISSSNTAPKVINANELSVYPQMPNYNIIEGQNKPDTPIPSSVQPFSPTSYPRPVENFNEPKISPHELGSGFPFQPSATDESAQLVDKNERESMPSSMTTLNTINSNQTRMFDPRTTLSNPPSFQEHPNYPPTSMLTQQRSNAGYLNIQAQSNPSYPMQKTGHMASATTTTTSNNLPSPSPNTSFNTSNTTNSFPNFPTPSSGIPSNTYHYQSSMAPSTMASNPPPTSMPNGVTPVPNGPIAPWTQQVHVPQPNHVKREITSNPTSLTSVYLTQPQVDAAKVASLAVHLLTDSELEILSLLEQVLKRIQATSDSSYLDILSRFNDLKEKMSNTQLAHEVLQLLRSFASSLNEGDYQSAQRCHTQLTHHYYHLLGSKSMLGLKRMWQIAEKHTI